MPAPHRIAGLAASLRARAKEYARHRAPALGLLAVAVVLSRLHQPAPPPKSLEGVAGMLGAATHGTVLPADFVWESSGGGWRDAILGRRVLFLARANEHDPRDLFRASVRVSREGRPIVVSSVRNLTSTPLGDEQMLAAHGHYAAFVTLAFDRVQGATLLDLEGRDLSGLSLASRLMASVDNWLETGSARGFGRTEVVLGEPTAAVEMAVGSDVLRLGLGEPPSPVELSLGTGRLLTAAGNPFRVASWSIPQRVRPLSHFVMDGLRQALGTDAADTLKSLVFRARSSLVRLAQRLRGNVGAPSGHTGPLAPPKPDRWPPETITPVLQHPLEHEGEWRVPPVSFLPPTEGASSNTETYLYETEIRPDAALPFAKVRLVAMDTRQLELGIEAGFDDPRPLTGPRGSGRIPTKGLSGEPLPVVAAFNGAFQTQHGAYGMVVDRRVLLPPKPGAATVAVDVTGRAWMGSWGASDDLPPWVISLRQNLDPLLDGAAINPRQRADWGFPLEGESMLTERSALCLTRSGFLIYGWGMEISPETLAKGLALGGCSYGMHLDMNPGHVGLTYLHIRPDGVDAALLAREMSIAPRRFVEGSPKDFFYLVLRDRKPQTKGAVDWTPDGGTQPPPSYLPAVYAGELERQGVKVRLWLFAPGRLSWQIRPGRKEQAAWTADGPLEPELQARALVAISLGVAFRKENRRGLALHGVLTLPIRPDLGVLAASARGEGLAIGLSVADMAPRGDASELVLLADEGQLRSEARELGPMRQRAAGCTLADGTLLVAQSKYDSAEANSTALVDLGCKKVVDLNRGHQLQGFVHRAGLEPPPRDYYEDTVLYGFSTESSGTARRLEEHDGYQ